MKEKAERTAHTSQRELNLTRIFDAPRELVWKAWTDPKMVAQWWGPRGFDNPLCQIDVRPGGAIRIHMRGPDGVVYPMTGVFHEILPPERLVFTSWAFMGDESVPLFEVLNTVIFEVAGSKTRLTLKAVVDKAMPGSEGPLSGMEQGWSQSLQKLAELLS